MGLKKNSALELKDSFSHIPREPGFHAVGRTIEVLGFGSLKEQDMFLLSIALKTSWSWSSCG
jgi:hypothetical protein